MVELRVVPQQIENGARDRVLGAPTAAAAWRQKCSARLYEAFYSTKADGMGIGLSLCRSIVESHLGRMKAENLYNGAAGRRAVASSFWLPLADADRHAAERHTPTRLP